MKNEDPNVSQARREFMEKCGRFAAVTPPALTFLLSTTMNSNAVAASVKGNDGNDNNNNGNNNIGNNNNNNNNNR